DRPRSLDSPLKLSDDSAHRSAARDDGIVAKPAAHSLPQRRQLRVQFMSMRDRDRTRQRRKFQNLPHDHRHTAIALLNGDESNTNLPQRSGAMGQPAIGLG